ncbi:MAG: HAD family phosphatase [Clostridiales bacterium]|nr:HAD family phosphatase [Clostridiales bacterium]
MKGAIFDLDGTLLDSMGVWAQIDEEFLAARGIEVPDDYQEAAGHLGFRGTAEYTIARFGFTDTPEELMELWDSMAIKEYANSIELKPGAYEYLEKLRREGVQMAIATASPMRYVLPALERHGIREWFCCIVSVDDVERGKGFPDVYLRAAELMGLSAADCTVFEDILPGLQGAKAGGFRAVGVAEEASKKYWEEMQALADGWVCDFHELL